MSSLLLTNLPIPLTSFVGRTRELAHGKRLLHSCRLLTLTGPGGVGKTRLALALGTEVHERFPDGVLFVELGGVESGALVPHTVLRTLGLPEPRQGDLLAELIDQLKSRSLLFILDCCEHLARACSDLAHRILSACPGVQIVATSQHVLGVPGEVVLEVPPLPYPEVERTEAEQLMAWEAVQLLCDRVRSVQPDFALTRSDAPAVVEICRMLEGMPLAIELAASRARGLSLEQIAGRLRSRLRFLGDASRTGEARQRTLSAAIEWSFRLLTDEDRRLWTRLSVFAEGFTLEAAEPVCSGDGVEVGAICDLLLLLVDHSMVTATHQGASKRFRMLDTLREYGMEKLQEQGQEAHWQDRHLQWCLEMVQRTEQERTGLEAPQWLRRLDAERDNLRAALEWSSTSPERNHVGLQLIGALRPYFELR